MTDIQALVLGIRKERSWRKLAAGDTTVRSTPLTNAPSIPTTIVALHLNRRLWQFTAFNSALTQFWCSLGTCGTLAGIDDKSVISRKPLLRSE
jgi:hypothetical protein